jgi:methionine synthase I (cobalamin-dependent)
MTRTPFLEALDTRVLVCDGAMGTMLYAKGIFLNRSFDELNLTQPDLVADVHQAYVRAGADVIETNTFGANRIKLGAFGLADKVHAINLQGAKIARHAARDQVYVAGAIGPLGIRIEPWGKTGMDEAEEFFRDQARGLLEGGVHLFVLETFRDVNEIGAAIRAVRSICDLPIVAQVTTEEDGNSLDGAAPEAFVPELERLGAQVVGLNCSV